MSSYVSIKMADTVINNNVMKLVYFAHFLVVYCFNNNYLKSLIYSFAITRASELF